MNSERIVSLAQRTAFRDPENNYKENTEIKNTVCQGDYPPDTSLYLHIPFCIRKCSYCDFLSSPQDEGTREKYVQALIREILVQGDCFSGTKVDTIFFGGGTPSILTEKQISRILFPLCTQKRVFLHRPDDFIPSSVTERDLKIQCAAVLRDFFRVTDNLQIIR